MEYLMTYGWAVLIISVVLVSLFALGVFNSNAGLGSTCIAASPFLCSTPVLTSTGNVQFTFGQSSGQSYYNVALLCVSTSNTYAASPTWPGAAAPISISSNSIGPGSNTLASGQSVIIGSSSATFTGIPCYPASGPINTAQSIGGSFTGVLWVNYTVGNSAASAANPWLTSRVGTLNAKVAH